MLSKFQQVWLNLLLFLLAWTTTILCYRLPTNVLPSFYNIDLYMNRRGMLTRNSTMDYRNYYDGTVKITLKATHDNVNQIQLHASRDFIIFKSVHFNGALVTQITIDKRTDIVTLGGFVVNSNADSTLTISFTGRASNDDLYGFYSEFKKDYLWKTFASQFKPIYARRAFPCFDEPAFKAIFKLSINHPSELFAISTMSDIRDEDYSSLDSSADSEVYYLQRTDFPKTPVMSTYSFVFFITRDLCTTAEYVDSNVWYQTCSMEIPNARRKYAHEFGISLMRRFNTLTQYPFSAMGLRQWRQVSVTDAAEEIQGGFGILSYRDDFLLWDDNWEYSNIGKQNIVHKMARQISQQCFGHLVSMQWWSEVFLNEGVATYFEYFLPHELLPEWELDKQWVPRVQQRALQADSLPDAQALQAPANSDAEVKARFNEITSLKGGSIFRMLEKIMGRLNFINGFRAYVQRYAHKNTLPHDLWNILDGELSTDRIRRLPREANLHTVMKKWIEDPGYPIIYVENVKVTVIISQRGKFLQSSNKSNNDKWYIPITYFTDSNIVMDYDAIPQWLLPTGVFEVPYSDFSPEFGEWIVINNFNGFYRVNYGNMWERLAEALAQPSFSKIPELNRASIVDDAFNLARARHINYTRLFKVIEFLKDDISYYSWLSAIDGFNYLLRRVRRNTNLTKAIMRHAQYLVSKVFPLEPWTIRKDAEHRHAMRQGDVFHFACKIGLPECIKDALKKYDRFLATDYRPLSNLRVAVYSYALYYRNNSQDWYYLWKYNYGTIARGNTAIEKTRLLTALGCSQDKEMLEQYLQFTLTDDAQIAPHNRIIIFQSVYKCNLDGIRIAFDFLKKYYKLIHKRFKSRNALAIIIADLTEQFTTGEEIEELRKFFKEADLPEDVRPAAHSALATAEANLDFYNYHQEHLMEYYEDVRPAIVGEEDESDSAKAIVFFLPFLPVIFMSVIF